MRGIEFKGKLVSVFMPADLETQGLPEAGAFFPTMYSFPVNEIILDGGHPIKLDESTAVFAVYETDKKTIALNVAEEALALNCSPRLLDTRYGLVLYIKWTLSPGTPQEISAEQYLNMHAETTRNILNNMFELGFFILAYCDLNEHTVVRSSLMLSENFQVVQLVFEKATQILASGETYAQECDMAKAQQEVSDYVDKHPISEETPRVLPVPEKTYE